MDMDMDMDMILMNFCSLLSVHTVKQFMVTLALSISFIHSIHFIMYKAKHLLNPFK